MLYIDYQLPALGPLNSPKISTTREKGHSFSHNRHRQGTRMRRYHIPRKGSWEVLWPR